MGSSAFIVTATTPCLAHGSYSKVPEATSGSAEAPRDNKRGADCLLGWKCQMRQEKVDGG